MKEEAGLSWLTGLGVLNVDWIEYGGRFPGLKSEEDAEVP